MGDRQEYGLAMRMPQTRRDVSWAARILSAVAVLSVVVPMQFRCVLADRCTPADCDSVEAHDSDPVESHHASHADTAPGHGSDRSDAAGHGCHDPSGDCGCALRCVAKPERVQAGQTRDGGSVDHTVLAILASDRDFIFDVQATGICDAGHVPRSALHTGPDFSRGPPPQA